MQTLFVEKRMIRSGSMLRDAYYVVDQDGIAISQPFPTRYLARKERQLYADEYSDVLIGEGRREAA